MIYIMISYDTKQIGKSLLSDISIFAIIFLLVYKIYNITIFKSLFYKSVSPHIYIVP